MAAGLERGKPHLPGTVVPVVVRVRGHLDPGCRLGAVLRLLLASQNESHTLEGGPRLQ